MTLDYRRRERCCSDAATNVMSECCARTVVEFPSYDCRVKFWGEMKYVHRHSASRCLLSLLSDFALWLSC